MLYGNIDGDDELTRINATMRLFKAARRPCHQPLGVVDPRQSLA